MPFETGPTFGLGPTIEGILQPEFTREIRTIFARTTGNDASGDGSIGNPYATMQRAVRDVPAIIPPGVQYVVDITGITEVLPADYELPTWKAPKVVDDLVGVPFFVFQTAVAIEAQPQLVAAIPPADAIVAPVDIASSVAQVGSGLLLITITAPRASWGGNALKGKFVVGANALENATIIESTTTTILVTQTAVPGLTGTLQIMEPSATIVASTIPTATNRGGLAARNCDSLSFNGLRVLNATPGATQHGLESAGSGVVAVQMCELQDPLLWSLAIDNNRLNRLWIYGDRSRVAGSWSLQAMLFDSVVSLEFSGRGPVNGNWRRVAIMGCSTARICQSNFPGQTAVVGVPAVTFIGENVLIANTSGVAGDGFRFHGARGVLRNVDIRNCGRDGVRVETGVGYLELLNVRTTVPNAGIGVRISDGMIVRVDAATSAAIVGTQLRGAGGEMKVGTLAARTWADFVGVAPIKNEYDLSTPFVIATSGVAQPPGDELTGAGTGGRSGSRLYQI